jgi:hypothetical protein
MNRNNSIIVVVSAILLGVSAAYSWSGFGTGNGMCKYTGSNDIPGAHQFTPFAYWEGHSSNGIAFSGFWRDEKTGEQGLFQGSWCDPAPYPSASFIRESKGIWFWLKDGAYVEMGQYEMNCEVWYTGNAAGSWSTAYEDWQGSGSMTGDDPNIPYQDVE